MTTFGEQQYEHRHGPDCDFGAACDNPGTADKQNLQMQDGTVVPLWCDFGHTCDAHGAFHKHAVDCGHEAVSHDGHVDYLVSGHLHHPHGDHCDNHGRYEK